MFGFNKLQSSFSPDKQLKAFEYLSVLIAGLFCPRLNRNIAILILMLFFCPRLNRNIAILILMVFFCPQLNRNIAILILVLFVCPRNIAILIFSCRFHFFKRMCVGGFSYCRVMIQIVYMFHLFSFLFLILSCSCIDCISLFGTIGHL